MTIAALPSLPLERGWQLSSDDGASWRPLSSLADLPPGSLPLRLRCMFDLQPTEVCVRYLLHVAAAPPGTLITINGWRAGSTSGVPFQANITDQVALEDNVIELVLSAAGSLRGVSLQPVPCP